VQSRRRRNRTAPFCFVIKGNVWWKRTFLPMVTIDVLHHKNMKLFTPFTPHVIAWSVRKGFNQSIRRTKEQKMRLQCLASAGVPKRSPSIYPFGFSIDEHVPLNMSARTIFFREGPIVHFPGVGQNIFAGGNKCGKI